MPDFLRKAFGLATNSINYIGDLNERIGFLTMRLFMDDTLFDIDTSAIKSPVLRKAVDLLHQGCETAQDILFNSVHKKVTGGDYSPQPDIKPGLAKFMQVGIAALPRIGLTPQSAVMFLSAGVMMGATYMMYQAGSPSTVSDTNLLLNHRNDDKRSPAHSQSFMPSVQP